MSSIETLAADRARINISWLLTLRWAAVVGQLLTILVVWLGLGIEVPALGLLAVVGITAASNLGLSLARRRRERIRPPGGPEWGRLLGSIMTVDLLVLTLMLYLTGGPFNPFVTFYVVNVALGAVLLKPRWSWFLFALALGCNGLLIAAYWPWFGPHRPDLRTAYGQVGMAVVEVSRRLYVIGASVATVIAATTTVYFISRLAGELAWLDAELDLARRRKERSERLEGLATLATGAAHELASPLSTIAVVVKELERSLLPGTASDEVIDDLRLIRQEVGRCRAILDHMAASAGEATGEPMVAIDAGRLAAMAVEILRAADRDRVRVEGSRAHGTLGVRGPERTLAQVLRGLLQNGIDASPPGETVVLTCSERAGQLVLEVRDRGAGMAPDVLSRIGEPFYTTKEPGRGMGLGLFLARTVLTRLGGALEIDSSPGLGTLVTVRLPGDRA